MSEEAGQTPNDDGQGSQAGQGESKTFTQEQVNAMMAETKRKTRESFADYDDLKSKAAKLDQAEEAKKTELQKAEDRARAAEDRAQQAESTALRAEVAASKGVPASSLSGTTKAELEQAADQLLSWRDEGRKSPSAVPTRQLQSGASQPAGQMTRKQQAAAALRDMRANR